MSKNNNPIIFDFGNIKNAKSNTLIKVFPQFQFPTTDRKLARQISIVTVLFCLIVGLISCGEEDEWNNMYFVSIGNGDRGLEQDRIITYQEEWDDLLMNLSKYEVEHFTETEIDFDNYIIIAIADEGRPSTHWNIFIKHIKEYPDKIVVTVHVKAPQGAAFDVLTRPYYIVKIPVTEKKIEFVKNEK